MFTGQILDGRYEILKEIGRGGMARVYLAMDVRLHKSWAVKEIRKDGQDGEHKVAVSSLLAEAEMMKKLDAYSTAQLTSIYYTVITDIDSLWVMTKTTIELTTLKKDGHSI